MNTIAEQPTTEDTQDRGLRDQFLTALTSKRKDAIDGRASSGIETDWQEDEEHYQGIDDANRMYQNSTRLSQPKRWASTGRGTSDKKPSRSVVFLNITRPYVDAASARVADMLLPTDDRAWELKPTPLPRLDQYQLSQLGGAEAARQMLDEIRAQALDASERMQEEIEDCLTESNWHGEVRQVIEDASRIGSGALKGPFPTLRNGKVVKTNEIGIKEYVSLSEIKPGSKRIDCWNLFPDPACGDNIHNGSYIWEREYLSARQLREMVKMPGYDVHQIVAAIKEGPAVNSARDAAGGTVERSEDQWEMWIFHGYCDTDQLKAQGVDVDAEDDADKLPAMAVMINDRLVKVTLTALDSGDFPYDVLAWQARPGMPWGMGVGRQIRTAQRMLNGAARAMMDNSGLSAAPQIIIGNGVTPDDGQMNLRGGKIWRSEADIQDVTKAFASFRVESVQTELMNIINFALKMAEDTTGMPAMLQGIKGDTPNTLGGMQMQNNNATSVLRRLAKRFDDYMTRPHIQRYFDWMMQYSDDDSIKGDFQIDVRASSALVERDAQQQFIMQMTQLARDPAYEINPARLFAELAKGQRLDPKRFQYTPDELAKRQQAQPDPGAEAKAALDAAKAEKTRAETTEVRGRTMYSAMQSAQVVAANPLVTPTADQLLGTIGFEDQDAAPYVDMPAPAAVVGAQLDDGVPTNTDPLTPTSPALGYAEGIETPEPDGTTREDAPQ